MMVRSGEPGSRKHVRVAFERPGFLVMEPNGPWIECFIQEVSDEGARIKVGPQAVPKLFVLLLSPNGDVWRICQAISRKGEMLAARFITAGELEGLRETN